MQKYLFIACQSTECLFFSLAIPAFLAAVSVRRPIDGASEASRAR